MGTKLADYLIQNPLYGYGRDLYTAPQQPIKSPLEGLARALTQGVGGYFAGQGLQQAKDEQGLDQKALAEAMTKYGSDPAAARQILATRPNLSDVATTLLASDVGYQRQVDLLQKKQDMETNQLNAERQSMGLPPLAIGGGKGVAGPQMASAGGGAANAIGGIESGGRYDAVGPVANAAGNRAYGKYQVLDSNIGPWTKEVLGKEMTPQEFVANPQAQDAVFTTKFGQYRQKYGPEGAARAWFAGEGGMNNPNARDVNGTTVAGYGQRFTAAGGAGPQVAGQPPAQVAQGSGPQVAPGQQAQPQALNVPADSPVQYNQQNNSVVYRGLEIPRPAWDTIWSERDPSKRHEMLIGQINEANKRKEGPEPGTTAGDVHILNRALQDPAFATTPEYRASFNRVFAPTMSQNGQLLYQDSKAYPKPITEQGQAEPQARMQDTPQSRFQMANKLADDFNQMDPVKRYGVVVPVYQSMQETVGKNDKLSDANLVYGISTIFDPGSVVRDGERVMIVRAQSLPDQVKGWISSINGGSALSPETRQAIMREAGSRVGALKAQHDAIAEQFSERAQRYGLEPKDVLTLRAPSASAQPEATQTGPVKIDINGKPR